tara:strand:+ start:267 stop:491 length:225 start_codon:yes stop_codon:yes gene_type:complete
MAALNIETEELLDRKIETFESKDVNKEMAEVQYNHWQNRRKHKLVQIENALKIKRGENPFLSLGIPTTAVIGMS